MCTEDLVFGVYSAKSAPEKPTQHKGWEVIRQSLLSFIIMVIMIIIISSSSSRPLATPLLLAKSITRDWGHCEGDSSDVQIFRWPLLTSTVRIIYLFTRPCCLSFLRCLSTIMKYICFDVVNFLFFLSSGSNCSRSQQCYNSSVSLWQAGDCTRNTSSWYKVCSNVFLQDHHRVLILLTSKKNHNKCENYLFQETEGCDVFVLNWAWWITNWKYLPETLLRLNAALISQGRRFISNLKIAKCDVWRIWWEGEGGRGAVGKEEEYPGTLSWFSSLSFSYAVHWGKALLFTTR